MDPDDVVGRDAFIIACWRTLETQGLYITGERRMGKSSIVRDKMGSEPAAGHKLVYLDVSNAGTPLEFVDGLLREAKKLLGAGVKFKLSALDLFQRLAPSLEVAQVVKLPESLALHWKDMLKAVLADFAKSGMKVVLVFDELPLMLDKIKRGMGENVAMDVLDTLRKERQTDKRLRMVYTGSLGLHHVLTELEDGGYQNAPLNDMKPVELGPLSEEDAIELARRLLRGIEVPDQDLELLAQHLARITDGMPFYVQNLVGDLADSGEKCSPATADRILTERLTDLSDPWDFGYYVKRINTHYQPASRPIALAFLDQLADTPRTFDELLDGLDPQKVVPDEAAAQRALELLGKDHYITQEDAGAFRFRYPLIARAWQYKRPLSARGKRR